jgi:hypothetical protein
MRIPQLMAAARRHITECIPGLRLVSPQVTAHASSGGNFTP